MFMKPFDGGGWRGVSMIKDQAALHRAYDESGEMLMHLQAAVKDYDVFARALSIGAETMVMKFQPDEPMHNRYAVEHGFLSPQAGEEAVTISRVVNAFFRWEFNSCEMLVKNDQVHPIDYANACPDVAVTSLHYYFPWAMSALLKWTVVLLRDRTPLAAARRHGTVVRHRRPHRPVLRGEAGGVSRSWPTRTSRPSATTTSWRRGSSHVDELVFDWVTSAGLRRAAGRHGARDLPGARVGEVPGALPRPGRPVGQRPVGPQRD